VLNARGYTPAQAVRRVRDARVPYAVSRKQLGWVSDLDHSYGADVEDPAIVVRSTAEAGAIATHPGWVPPSEIKRGRIVPKTRQSSGKTCPKRGTYK